MRRRWRRCAGAAGSILAALALAGADASAATGPPLTTRLVDLLPDPSHSPWEASRNFLVSWRLEPNPGGTAAPVGIAYRLRDPLGNPLGPVTEIGLAERDMTTILPAGATEPGEYELDIWLVGTAGDGPVARAPLRFDDARPAPVGLIAPSGWVRAGREVELAIDRSPATPPPSGVRGYAVTVDHGTGDAPCAGRERCEPQEVDATAAASGVIAVGPLTEGVNLARIVAVSGSGLTSASAGSTELRVDGTPPSVTLTAPSGWSAGPVAVTASARDDGSGMAAAGPAGAFTAVAVDGGVASVSPGATATALVHDEGAHGVGAYASDAVGNFSAGGESSEPPWSAIVRIDETAPVVSFAVRQDPAEPERIVARVEDALAGSSTDRGAIAIRPFGSTALFEPIPTSVGAGRLTAHWDSDSYPVGRYEFRATGYDVAGNRKTTELRGDGRPLVLENPVKTPATLAFGFGGRKLVWHSCRRVDGELRCHRRLIGPFAQRPTTRSAAYGRSVPIAGRLSTPFGAATANQRVEVVETFAAGAESRERRTTLLTNAEGEFLAHLPPGPSRQVEVRFDGGPTLTRAGAATLHLRVRTAVRLRSSAATAAIGGAPVVFSGSVAHEGASIPATGLPVALQFRLPDVPWTEFRTVQTGPDGRFRFPYAFSDDDSRGVRFQFRAHLAAQPGWPFDPGNSRAVTVTGR